MLVDDITVKLEAGAGGRGGVAFTKVRLALGPTGGNGGHGGGIYLEGGLDIGALAHFAHMGVIRAKDGKDGRGKFLDGANGLDLILTVPRGTRITNVETGFVQEINEIGERVLVAGGGIGGKGNFKFRSPVNTTPYDYEEGTPGDKSTFRLELRLIADVGLVGLPNAGKSSLLNELTNTKSKVASYAFTTLQPHIGSFYGLLIADIPGLIEGASEGKGLGVKFLRHIERTRTIFHLVSAETDDVVRDYETVRAELANYNADLAAKEERVFLTKSDMVSKEELKKSLAALKKKGVTATPVSIVDDASMEKVKEILQKMLKKAKPSSKSVRK